MVVNILRWGMGEDLAKTSIVKIDLSIGVDEEEEEAESKGQSTERTVKVGTR